jgi:hypothetical protein
VLTGAIFITVAIGTSDAQSTGSLITGFEPQEGYAIGDLNNQNGWKVDSGSAEVSPSQVFSGVQAVRVAPGGQISHGFDTASPVVTFDSYLQAVPSSAPEIPNTSQLAVLYLDQSGGITGLNGNGSGGGNWVSSGVSIAPGTWFRVTIRLDFTARTWSCAINDIGVLSNLRFHSNHVLAFSSLTVSAQGGGETLLDQINVTTKNPPLSLAIKKLAAAVELSWPLSVNGYRLQSSPSLAPASWIDVSTMENQLIQPTATPSMFFRLVGP